MRPDATDPAVAGPRPSRAPAPSDVEASRVPANDNRAPWRIALRRGWRRALMIGVAAGAALAFGYLGALGS